MTMETQLTEKDAANKAIAAASAATEAASGTVASEKKTTAASKETKVAKETKTTTQEGKKEEQHKKHKHHHSKDKGDKAKEHHHHHHGGKHHKKHFQGNSADKSKAPGNNQTDSQLLQLESAMNMGLENLSEQMVKQRTHAHTRLGVRMYSDADTYGQLAEDLSDDKDSAQQDADEASKRQSNIDDYSTSKAELSETELNGKVGDTALGKAIHDEDIENTIN